MKTEECKWFTLEEMKLLCESQSLLGPEPVELATSVANIKGLFDDMPELDSIISSIVTVTILMLKNDNLI